MINNVHFAFNDEELEWFANSRWTQIDIKIESPKHKQNIMKWVGQYTSHNIVILPKGATRPSYGTSDWSVKLLGKKDNYKIYFENDDEAAYFKLVWG